MAKFLEILDKHLDSNSAAIQSKIAERESKINSIISEAFVGKYPTKELAANRITNEFALELCVSEDLDMEFLRENKELLVDKINTLTEGEIKIIINNDVNRGKGGAVVPMVGEIEMESKTPKKRGRPPKAAVVETPKEEVVVEAEEIEMPEQTAQLIVDKAVEFGLNKEETINLVKNMFTNDELAPKIIDSEFVGQNIDEITDMLDGMDADEFAGDFGTEESSEESEEEAPEGEEESEEESEESEEEEEEVQEEGKTSIKFNKKGFFGPINESQKFLLEKGFLTESNDEHYNDESDERQNVAESDEDFDELEEAISPTWEIILKNGVKMVIKAKEILSDIGATELHLPGGNSIQLPSPIKGIEPVYSEGADNDDHNLNLEVNECEGEKKSKFAKYATEALKKMGTSLEEEDEIEFEVGEDGEGEAEESEEEAEDGTEEHEEAETPEEEEAEHAEGGEEEGVEDEEESEEEESEGRTTLSPDSVDVEKDGEGIKISLKFDDIKDLIAKFDNEDESEEEEEEESEEEEAPEGEVESEEDEAPEGEEDEEGEAVDLFVGDEEEPEESEEESEESEEEESEESEEEEAPEGEEESEEEESEEEEEEEEEVKEAADPTKKKMTYVVSKDGKTDSLELDFEYDEDQKDPDDEYVKDYVTKTYGAKATFRKK